MIFDWSIVYSIISHRIRLLMANEIASFSLSQFSTPPRPYRYYLVLQGVRHQAFVIACKVHFRVENNPSRRATVACWKVFGLPVMSKDENPTKFEILHEFVSCKTCFDT